MACGMVDDTRTRFASLRILYTTGTICYLCSLFCSVFWFPFSDSSAASGEIALSFFVARTCDAYALRATGKKGREGKGGHLFGDLGCLLIFLNFRSKYNLKFVYHLNLFSNIATVDL